LLSLTHSIAPLPDRYFSHLFRGENKFGKRGALLDGERADPFRDNNQTKEGLAEESKEWGKEGASIRTKWSSKAGQMKAKAAAAAAAAASSSSSSSSSSGGEGVWPENVVFFTSSFPHFTSRSRAYQDRRGTSVDRPEGGNQLAQTFYDVVTGKGAANATVRTIKRTSQSSLINFI
jgi:hypothetical protein